LLQSTSDRLGREASKTNPTGPRAAEELAWRSKLDQVELAARGALERAVKRRALLASISRSTVVPFGLTNCSVIVSNFDDDALQDLSNDGDNACCFVLDVGPYGYSPNNLQRGYENGDW
jgi:hypothetical protein